MIFPHGTRTQAGERKKLQSGITAIYNMLPEGSAGCVVPATLNSGAHWPKKGRMTSGIITWTFHPALPSGLTKKEFMTQLDSHLNPPEQK